jgi:hypothetical protein
MRRPRVCFAATLLAVLATGTGLSRESGSGPIREFREGWSSLGGVDELGYEEYEELIVRMERLAAEIARGDEEGRQVLFESLRTPTSPVLGPGAHLSGRRDGT